VNVLFALYHDFTSNSAIHVHSFANQLAAFGHQVAVAVPDNKETAANLGETSYTVGSFLEFDGRWEKFFPNGRSPDVVHGWTPRENVRLFCEKLAGFCSYRLVVHLEDNEELILELNLGRPFAELAAMASLQMPPNLSHPRNYRRFLAGAQGVTIIMDRLQKFVPDGVPHLVLWPGADRALFHPQPKDNEYLESLGVPADHLVLCYTGNVHSANAREVRSLYLAVAMLNREGIPATLVRAGADYCSYLGPEETWAREHAVEIGYVRHFEIPQLLNLADYLVQPGRNDAFNEFRLPAKLTEFFSMGRPVILPHTNVGRFVEHGKEAWVLEKVDALGLVETIQRLHGDSARKQRLAEGAFAFANEHFSWSKNARALEQFYQSLAESQLTKSDASSHPLSR
jgi:glycosyltransferase involved in cell wall biosynthesis